MKKHTLPDLDRTAFVIASLTAPSGEKEFWFARSPYTRLAAVETMREIVYGYSPLTTRLQRVFEAAKRS